MGLDLVEFVMAVEERFGIAIPDEDACKLETVGNVYDYVLSKVQIEEPNNKVCLSSNAFYRLRRALMETSGLQRSEIRPGTLLADLTGKDRRRALWTAVHYSTGFKLPELHRPTWLVSGITATGLVAFVGVFALLPGSAKNLFVPGAAGLAAATVLVLATELLRREFPKGLRTVGDLVNEIVRLNTASLLDALNRKWDPQLVWDTLVDTICEQLPVDKSQIVRTARFVKDLGCN